jgi:hypothetical protein
VNRRTRLRIALIGTFPTLLTLPLMCLVTAFGVLPWTVLLAWPVVLVVQVAVHLRRLDRSLRP